MNKQELTKLGDPQKIKEFDRIIEEVVFSDNISDAKKIAEALKETFKRNPDFQQANKALFSVYNSYLVAVQYVALFELTEQEIINLIKHNLDFVFSYPEYNLNQKVRFKIRDINNLASRDNFKEKIRQALLECDVVLGREKINVNGAELRPTVGNWLRDYNVRVGIDKVDPLKFNEYLTSNKNIKLITDKEKANLKMLLNFFENMKVSSQQYPAFEESIVAILPDDSVKLILGGQFVETETESLKFLNNIKKTIVNNSKVNDILTDTTNNKNTDNNTGLPEISSLEASLKNYSPASLEYKAIKQELGRLERLTPKDKTKK